LLKQRACVPTGQEFLFHSPKNAPGSALSSVLSGPQVGYCKPAHRAHLLHIQYDEYLPDRPETRLVRLSLERIQRMTVLDASRRLARELLLALEGVPPCVDVKRDLQAWRTDRGHAHFAPLEDICRLVLHELNPLAGGSSARALSVLFPMERVFESYVAGRLRAQQPDWTVRTQVTERALGDVQGQRAFPLRPDLHLTLPGGEIIIADTKWKRLDPNPPTYGVSNGDAYQMLAYSEVFQHEQPAPRLWLLYPRLRGLPEHPAHIRLPGGRSLSVVLLNLDQPDLFFSTSSERNTADAPALLISCLIRNDFY
jgi:5-methylcytosine-specific restriction enzyme subunit McrC